MTRSIERYAIEGQEDWRGWVDKIPALKFDADWKVKIIPGFAGALIRFLVLKGEARISVYLDVNNSLGYCCAEDGTPLPYWEVYPYKDDTYRCGMDETDKLLRAIRSSIKRQERS